MDKIGVLPYGNNYTSITSGDVVSQKSENIKQGERAMKVAKEFEASFMSTMWELATSGVQGDDSSVNKIYSSWLNNEYAKILAPKMGLAHHVQKRILELQGTDNKK